MKMGSRRVEEAGDAPFHGPGRLALALPLMAALGLTTVMAAIAAGEPTPFVALAAATGFVACGAAPLALMHGYVRRPLRLALAHLRAARDGAEPPGAPPEVGVIADLVAVARDIHAGRAQVAQYRAGMAICEQMAAAGDEAIRAYRRQCEELAETTAQGESQRHAATQAQFAEIAGALDALKATTPSAALESGVERIEQMLVYLAEALERREPSAEAQDRVEGALADIVEHIGREAQTVRESVAAAALTVRDDIAGAVADDKAGQAWRQETLEARVLTRIDAAVAAPAARLGEMMAGLHEQGRAQAARLDAMEARLTEGARDGEAAALAVLAKCTDKLRNALDRFDVLSAAAATTANGEVAEIGAAVRALQGELAALGDRLAPEEAPQLAALCERLDAFEAKSLQPASRDLAAAQARCESFARQIALSAAALAALAEREGQDFDRLRAAFDGAAAAMQAQAQNAQATLGETLSALQRFTQALAASPAPETEEAEQAAVVEAHTAYLSLRDDEEMRSLHEAVAELGVQLSGMRTDRPDARRAARG